MIVEVNTKLECEICDEFLTLLIQDERKYDNTIEKEFIVKNYFINMIKKEHILLMYKENDKAIGYVFAKKISSEYLIDGIYVDTLFRKRGIATKLLESVIYKIKNRGNYNIYINVLKDNHEALNLYKKIGFVISSKTDTRLYMIYKKY